MTSIINLLIKIIGSELIMIEEFLQPDMSLFPHLMKLHISYTTTYQLGCFPPPLSTVWLKLLFSDGDLMMICDVVE